MFEESPLGTVSDAVYNRNGWSPPVIFTLGLSTNGDLMTSYLDLAKCQIKHIPTDVLVSLRNEFKIELELRRREERVSSVRQSIQGIAARTSVDRGLLEIANASNILEIPHKINLNMRLPYLRALINQDWSGSFPSGQDDAMKYYVYAHVNPDSAVFSASPEFGGSWGGTPFYIGKGCGQRAYDLKRNQAHGQHLANVLSAGFEPSDIVKIVKDGLTESQALQLEAKYIYFFGSAYDKNAGPLVNLDRTMIPEFKGCMTKYSRAKRENKHWIGKWKNDHAALLSGLATDSPSMRCS